jgi:hypothetical protein
MQGDPLSPILFNLVADMLAVLIESKKPRFLCWVGSSLSGGRSLNLTLRR